LGGWQAAASVQACKTAEGGTRRVQRGGEEVGVGALHASHLLFKIPSVRMKTMTLVFSMSICRLCSSNVASLSKKVQYSRPNFSKMRPAMPCPVARRRECEGKTTTGGRGLSPRLPGGAPVREEDPEA
jgi:hypothetical protein